MNYIPLKGVLEGARVRPASSAYDSANGSIGPFIKAGAPVNGDFNGEAGKGALLVDTTNARLYQNTGTLAATVWGLVGAQV